MLRMLTSLTSSLAGSLDALMQTTLPVGSILPEWLNPNVFLRDSPLGPWVILLVAIIIFAETGLLVGFFLPGDSLLFTAGMLVATGAVNVPLWVVIPVVIIAAVIGNQVGYLIGAKAGPALYDRPNSRLFKQEHLHKAHEFFARHGGKALILGRFVPIVRTFIPVIIGAAGMNRARYFLYNVIGGVLWGGGVTLLGVWLGRITWVGENIDLIFIVIVLLSVIPIAIEVLRRRKRQPVSAPDEV